VPPDRPHLFVYFITIHNDSLETVMIRGRKWVVTDAAGQRVVVEGTASLANFRVSNRVSNSPTTAITMIGCDSVAEGVALRRD
jgi:ApaG protein